MVVSFATPTFSAGLQFDQAIDVASLGVIGNCDQSFVDSNPGRSFAGQRHLPSNLQV